MDQEYGAVHTRVSLGPVDETDTPSFLTLWLPTIMERLVSTIFSWRITPPQPIAIDEVYSALLTTIITERFAVGLREKELKTRQLRIDQTEKIR